MNPHVGLRFGAAYTSLSGADSLSNIDANKGRNLSFGTHLFELHGGLELNMLPVDILRMKVSPYAFGGIAAFYYNPFAEDPTGSKVFLRPLSTEGQGLAMYPDRKQYSQLNISFPIGGGVKFFIGKAFLIATEVGFRYTNTDYLDDVSTTYAGENAFPLLTNGKESPAYLLQDRSYEIGPRLGVAGKQRGFSGQKDQYLFAELAISFSFSSYRCANPR